MLWWSLLSTAIAGDPTASPSPTLLSINVLSGLVICGFGAFIWWESVGEVR